MFLKAATWHPGYDNNLGGKPDLFMRELEHYSQNGNSAQCLPITSSYRAFYASPLYLITSSMAYKDSNYANMLLTTWKPLTF